MSDYKMTIGLEIHAELKTKSKMFCGCINSPEGKSPNIYICPVCMGHPGTLPVINKEAVKKVLLVGTALGGDVADFTEFDRKNYFYPDIPKGYQISQYKNPLVQGGTLNRVKITRIHLEEDTARSTHDTPGVSLVDYNRAGVPLMEMVTEPVIHNSEGAMRFAKEFQLLLQYLGVSDANMEKGEMRVEVNISVAKHPETLTSAEGRRNDAEGRRQDTSELLYEDLTYKIRGILFEVRKRLGLGHKEQIYHNALEIEFKKANLSFESKKNISILYEGKSVGIYQPDFIIENQIIIELKALPEIARPQTEQLWSYLKGCEYKLALLVNYGSKDLEIKRVVYDTARESKSIQRFSASGLRESAVPFGTKVEIKNINSFRAVGKAIDFEFNRQTALLERGEKVVQETRGWDENKELTFSQRLKESAHDYRYFEDPDLPKIIISEIPEFLPAELKKLLVELPEEKRKRLTNDFGLKSEDVEMYVGDREVGKFFETVAQSLLESIPRFSASSLRESAVTTASNYITSDIVGLSKSVGKNFTFGKINKEGFIGLMVMIGKGELSSRGAKDILKIMFEEGGDPSALANQKGLIQKNNLSEIKSLAEKIIRENPKVVEEYKNGKESLLQFFVGQGMKESKGSINPELFKKAVLELLTK
ncbi:MAG: GxxExxY protein [Candidatus Paceibacterota bacterium]|jgi:GxxExxY protein